MGRSVPIARTREDANAPWTIDARPRRGRGSMRSGRPRSTRRSSPPVEQPAPTVSAIAARRGDARANGQAVAAPRAIACFISATAERRPTKTARETIACPMWSSRTPGSTATAPTLA